jgi:hypothetical protein
MHCDVPLQEFIEVLSAWRAHLGQRK